MMNEIDTLNEGMGLVELSDAELEAVTGGTSVNTGSSSNAGVWKKFEDIASKKANYSVPNGTDVVILGAPQYNSAKGRNYVQVQFEYKGKTKKGWIAASIVGMGR